MIEDQEKADSIVAKQYSDRLLREAEIERRILHDKSEKIARKLASQQQMMQHDPSIPIPPRNQPKPSNSNKYLSHSPEASISPQLHYACLDLMPPDPQRKLVAASPDQKYTKITLQSHTPEKVVAPPPRPPKSSKAPQVPPKTDGVDSIRPYSDIDSALDEALDMEMQNLDINNLYKPNRSENVSAQFNPNIQQRHPHHQFLETKHDQNKYLQYDDDIEEDNAVGGSSNDNNHQPSTIDYREKIERLQALKILGLPPEEICEIDKRIEQEKKDEELARILQEEFSRDSDRSFESQLELDRKFAIER